MKLAEMTAMMQGPLSMVSKVMAARCEACPACRYARNNPESLFGRMMAWHGKYCPFWRAWQREYGDRAP